MTHDQDEAAVVADRIGVMREGRIVAEGEPEEMFTLPSDPWVASFLGTESPVTGVITRAEEGIATIDCGGISWRYPTGCAGTGRWFSACGRRTYSCLKPESTSPKTSARNRVDATVAAVSLAGATVGVVADAGSARFSATARARRPRHSGLLSRLPVTLLFKATAVRVQRQSGPPPQTLSEPPTPV